MASMRSRADEEECRSGHPASATACPSRESFRVDGSEEDASRGSVMSELKLRPPKAPVAALACAAAVDGRSTYPAFRMMPPGKREFLVREDGGGAVCCPEYDSSDGPRLRAMISRASSRGEVRRVTYSR